MKRLPVAVALAVVVSTSILAQEAVDLDAVHRIRTEALQNSQVM